MSNLIHTPIIRRIEKINSTITLIALIVRWVANLRQI